MPMSIKGFLLFFGPLFGLIILFAFAAFLLQVFRRRREAVREAAGRLALSAAELDRVAEFHTRRRRFHCWLWGGSAGAAAALALDWRLTAAALLLAPLAGAIIHLRCPACDSTPSLRGMIERGRCRRCGAYLGG